MAFIIVSSGPVAGSRPLTFAARPLLAAAILATVALACACVGLGYRLGRTDGSTTAVTRLDSDGPRTRAVIERVGDLAARLSRVEAEASAIASRLGLDLGARRHDPLATGSQAADDQAASTGVPDDAPGGGPFVPADARSSAFTRGLPGAGNTRLDVLERTLRQLENAMARMAPAAAEHELEGMAYPNRLPLGGDHLRITSGFGLRSDPFTGRRARHTGIDIAAPRGAPILASGGGRVRTAGYHRAYGNMVIIDHGDGLATLYGHASRLYVHAGDIVMPQQKIAAVGSTGRSSGPHLHFEVVRNGERVEPRDYVPRVLGRDAAR